MEWRKESETLLPEIMDAMIEDRAAQASPLRDRFLAAGMTVLGRDGYPGFKQAAVCRQTGLTTGAFYHSFRNWKEFEAALIEHWRAEATDRIVARLDVALAPHERIDALIAVALSLPHRSEAAIRIWAAGDVRVAESLSAVDAARRDAVARYLREIGIDPPEAEQPGDEDGVRLLTAHVTKRPGLMTSKSATCPLPSRRSSRAMGSVSASSQGSAWRSPPAAGESTALTRC